MDVTITKLVHACLLIETEGTRVLVDPGSFSWQDERLDLGMVEGVDRVLITHEHGDHVSVPFVKGVLERSNNAQIETTPALAAMLASEDLDAVTTGTPQFAAPHERLPIGPGPQNTGFHVGGVLSHPGDSHSFAETMPILAMPFISPWGSLTIAVDRVRLVKPRYVIPIHDWFLSNDGASFMYRLAATGLSGDPIELVTIDDFTNVTLSV
ncbi:MAG: MBL fold metallo-hydrolase [Actinomycetia bacterium]|nr:MBL fold metallo-hydrolase [Actinomycetes bacterium]